MDSQKLDLAKLLGFRLQGTTGSATTGLKMGDKGAGAIGVKGEPPVPA